LLEPQQKNRHYHIALLHLVVVANIVLVVALIQSVMLTLVTAVANQLASINITVIMIMDMANASAGNRKDAGALVEVVPAPVLLLWNIKKWQKDIQ